jgi:hypothetical protein
MVRRLGFPLPLAVVATVNVGVGIERRWAMARVRLRPIL